MEVSHNKHYIRQYYKKDKNSHCHKYHILPSYHPSHYHYQKTMKLAIILLTIQRTKSPNDGVQEDEKNERVHLFHHCQMEEIIYEEKYCHRDPKYLRRLQISFFYEEDHHRRRRILNERRGRRSNETVENNKTEASHSTIPIIHTQSLFSLVSIVTKITYKSFQFFKL